MCAKYARKQRLLATRGTQARMHERGWPTDAALRLEMMMMMKGGLKSRMMKRLPSALEMVRARQRRMTSCRTERRVVVEAANTRLTRICGGVQQFHVPCPDGSPQTQTPSATALETRSTPWH